MSPRVARAQSGINLIRWEPRFLFFRDLPSDSKPDCDRARTVVSDCWLYIFDARGPLLYEVYADDAGMYHEVDVDSHAGKDIRPYAMDGGGVRSSLPLIAGERTTKGIVPIHHWVLPSPFQLPWSRFPHITQEAVAEGHPSNFRTWAQATRELEHFVPYFRSTGAAEAPVEEVAITSPWLHAYALNRCFQLAQERWVSGFLNDPTRMERKILRSYVRSIESVVGKDQFERDLFRLLDEAAFNEEESKDKAREDYPPDELIKARVALVAYLKNPRFLNIRDDAMASPDPRAKAVFAEIQGNSDSGLEGLGGDPKYKESVCQANTALFKLEAEQLAEDVRTFLEKHPAALYGTSASVGWKEARKAVKSYWYLVKAYIAQIEWIAPRKLTTDLKAIGRMVFGVLVEFEFAGNALPAVSRDGNVKWPRLVVSPKAKARLAAKYSQNAAWNHFFVALDAYNLIMACGEQAKGKTDMKPVLAAMSSFLNTAASALEAGLNREGVKHLVVTDKMLAELAGEAAQSSGKGGTAGMRAMLRKFNQPRTIGAMGKLFGMVGSIVEACSSYQKIGKADAQRDDEAKAAHIVSMGANVAVSAGYLLGLVGTVCVIAVGSTVAWPVALVAIGSWLVAGGTMTDLGAKLYLAKYQKDPLENWLRTTPWALESRYRTDDFEKLSHSYHEALVGLQVNIRPGLTGGFDVTVQSRVAQSPGQVFLELEWVSEAGRFRNEMAPMNSAKLLGPNQFRHEEITSDIKKVTARVRLFLDGEWYPEKPRVFTYPS